MYIYLVSCHVEINLYDLYRFELRGRLPGAAAAAWVEARDSGRSDAFMATLEGRGSDSGALTLRTARLAYY